MHNVNHTYIFCKKRMKIEQVRAELQLTNLCGVQNQKLQKFNFL